MKARAIVLFRETTGCGDDTEANSPDGVAVTLTKWVNIGGDRKARNHYTLETTVINDHQVIGYKYEAIESGYGPNEDAKNIRDAVSIFDVLITQHMGQS